MKRKENGEKLLHCSPLNYHFHTLHWVALAASAITPTSECSQSKKDSVRLDKGPKPKVNLDWSERKMKHLITTVSKGKGLHLLFGREEVLRTFAVGF